MSVETIPAERQRVLIQLELTNWENTQFILEKRHTLFKKFGNVDEVKHIEEELVRCATAIEYWRAELKALG